MLTPSKQQQDIIDAVNAAKKGGYDIQVIALAGTGKTAAIIMCIPHMEGTVHGFAYNTAAGAELDERVTNAYGKDSEVQLTTVHKFAYGCWRRAYPKCKLEGNKTQHMLDEIIDAGTAVDETTGLPKNPQYAKAAEAAKYNGGFLKKLVSMAKQHALGVDGVEITKESLMKLVDHYDLESMISRPNTAPWAKQQETFEEQAAREEKLEFLVKVAYRIYMKSLKDCPEVIDFDDQILAPLYYNVKIPRKNWVIVDEAQDTNRGRKLIALRACKPDGNFMIVGDPNQAIYGFTGADADSMRSLMELRKEQTGREYVTMQLTETRRCPKAVVEHARKIVPEFTAHPDNLEGVVRFIKDTELDKETLWTGDAILCRKMAPLVELAYGFAKRKMAFQFDAKEFAIGLEKLVKVVIGKDKIEQVVDFETKLKTYATAHLAKLIEAKKRDKADRFENQVEVLLVFCAQHQHDSMGKMMEVLNQLFDNQTRKFGVLLTTVHRSKGREWDRVFLLGRAAYMPSKWATKSWQKVQERNLEYVALTRAKKELIEVAVTFRVGSKDSTIKETFAVPDSMEWLDTVDAAFQD